jgi:hypothetical protein
MADKIRKGGKKGRKVGRNKVKCERYRLNQTKERNNLRRAERRLQRHPADTSTKDEILKLRRILR